MLKLRAPRRNLHSQAAYNRALGATFTHGDGLRTVHTAVNSLDDVLELVQRQQRNKAVRKRHREEAGNPPPSRAQLFAAAKAQVAQGQRKVRMPELTFLKNADRDEIGAN